MSLTKDSPHLALTLKKKLKDLSSGEAIEKAFDFALAKGGREEIDYPRKPGMSFNPRPARVCLILINDLRVLDSEILQAAMLGCVWSDLARETELETLFGKRVISLAALASSSPSTLLENQDSSHKDVCAITAAIWLDRARHLHLSDPQQTNWWAFLTEVEKVISLAELRAPEAASRLSHWKKMFEQRHLPKAGAAPLRTIKADVQCKS